MLLVNLLDKEVTLTFTSDLMYVCVDGRCNDVFNLHLVMVIF